MTTTNNGSTYGPDSGPASLLIPNPVATYSEVPPPICSWKGAFGARKCKGEVVTIQLMTKGGVLIANACRRHLISEVKFLWRYRLEAAKPYGMV